MKLKNVIATLIMMVAGVQTVKAQKIILHMSDNQKVEYEISQLDSITFGEGVYLACPDGNHPHAIDLGLPSGTKWCCCNVGAGSPEEYGDYYAWGETEPKSEYSWSTYNWSKGSYDSMTKYCAQSRYGYNGFTDNLTELQSDDDAATANRGNAWQMPSLTQWQELINIDYTTMTWTKQNGVNGRTIMSKNGNSIFLPAAGLFGTTTLYDAGSCGDYWSRSLYTENSFSGCDLYFNTNSVGTGIWERYNGRSVRPVRVQE